MGSNPRYILLEGVIMGKKKDTADDIELEEEEEEDVEIEDEEVDEEPVEQVKDEEDEDEETEAEETEEEDGEKEEAKKAPGVAVRDSKLAEGITATIFNIFMQNVWPILKKNGWEKVRTFMAILVSLLFFLRLCITSSS
jgi:TATA-binding protein-associated factor Taf7